MPLNAFNEKQVRNMSLTLPYHITEQQEMLILPLSLCFSGCPLRCIDLGHGLADLCCVQLLFFNLQSGIKCIALRACAPHYEVRCGSYMGLIPHMICECVQRLGLLCCFTSLLCGFIDWW